MAKIVKPSWLEYPEKKFCYIRMFKSWSKTIAIDDDNIPYSNWFKICFDKKL